MIAQLIEDVIAEIASRRLEALAPARPSDVRAAAGPVVGFSAAMAEADAAIKAFSIRACTTIDRVTRVMGEAERCVRDLFAHYVATPPICRPNGRWASTDRPGAPAGSPISSPA